MWIPNISAKTNTGIFCDYLTSMYNVKLHALIVRKSTNSNPIHRVPRLEGVTDTYLQMQSSVLIVSGSPLEGVMKRRFQERFFNRADS